MKKLLSIFVLVCVMVSVCTVSAFATDYSELNTAATTGGTITLSSDVVVPDGTTIEVNGSLVIKLNGFTISGTDTSTGSAALIKIQPGVTLTIEGPGKISYVATNDRGTNNYSSTISNQRGILNVIGATIEHLGGTYMAYAIDNLTNGGDSTAYTTIYSGYISSAYRAIRQFANGGSHNEVDVKGGTIVGGNGGIWVQNPNSNQNPAKLTVASGSSVSKVQVSYSTTLNADISVAANAVNSVTATGVPAGEILANVNGTYGHYDSVKSAFDAAGENGSVGLAHSVDLSSDVSVPNGVTVNLNGNSVTGANLVAPNGGSMNVTDSVGGGSAKVNGNDVTGGNRVTVGTDGTTTVGPIPATPNNPGGTTPVVPAADPNPYGVPSTGSERDTALMIVLAVLSGSVLLFSLRRKKEA